MMKNTFFKMLMALGLVAVLTACGNSEKKTPDADVETLPTCTVTESTPITNIQIVVDAVCTGGNMPIDEATVSVSGQLKEMNINGSSIDEHVTFINLAANTNHTVTFEVIVGGETLTTVNQN